MPPSPLFNPDAPPAKRLANRAGSDAWSFFRAWLEAPLRVAAIAPSSTALAELITCEITSATGPVLELGAGTGSFTRALIARGIAESDLTLVEFGSDFARLLEMRFPAARVRWMDAACLREANLFESPVVGAVISGMPVLSMPPRKVIAILRGAFGYMRPGGAFYQFTYTTRCPIPEAILTRLGLKATRIGSTLRNLPPAAVYRISRRPPLRLV